MMDLMTTKNILDKFCDHSFEKLSTPFSFDGWTMASSQHIAIRVPFIEGFRDEPPYAAVLTMPYFPLSDGAWGDLPLFELPLKERCDVCRGAGKISVCPECNGNGGVTIDTSHHSYEVECKTCKGDGFITGGDKDCENCNGEGVAYEASMCEIVFNGNKLDGFLLEKIRDLPGVQIFSVPNSGHIHCFKFDGGHGILMGLSG
jgi:hypothetical protein